MHSFSMLETPQRPYLMWLKTGLKTAEGRVNTPSYRKVLVGDPIVFTNRDSGHFLRGIVTFKHEYPDFEAMLRAEGVRNMLPFCEDGDIRKALAVYQAFPGAHRVKEFGCVALGLRPTND